MRPAAADGGGQWGPLLGAVVLLHPSSLSLALEAPALLAGALVFGWANCGSQSSGEARRVASAGLGVALAALESAFAAVAFVAVPLLLAVCERQPFAGRRAALVAVPGLACAALVVPQSELPQAALEGSSLFVWLTGPALFLPLVLFFRVQLSRRVPAHHRAGGLALWLAALAAIAAGTDEVAANGLLAPWVAFAFAPGGRTPHLQSMLAGSVTACGALVLVTGTTLVTPAAYAQATFMVPVARTSTIQGSAPQRYWSTSPPGTSEDVPPSGGNIAEIEPWDDLQGEQPAIEPAKLPLASVEPIRLAGARVPATADWHGAAQGAVPKGVKAAATPSALKTILAQALDTSPELIPDLSFMRIDGLEEVNARAPLAALAVWNKHEVSAGIAVDEDIYVQVWGARVTTGPFGVESVEAGLTATIRF